MGYTHYLRVNDAEKFATAMADIAADARRIVGAVEVPVAGWDGTGEPTITAEEIRLNGRGPDDYETFAVLPQEGFSFCKTQYRPYDLIVTAILLRVQEHAGSSVAVSSDGDMYGEDWAPARRVVAELFEVRS